MRRSSCATTFDGLRQAGQIGGFVTQETRDRTKTTDRRVIDGHRLSEFVYGTVTGMVAVAGVGGTHETTWWNAASIIIVGAVAIWLAHSYSIIIGKRVSGGQRLGLGDLIDILRGSWPIVTAGTVLALPMLPAAFGVWNVDPRPADLKRPRYRYPCARWTPRWPCSQGDMAAYVSACRRICRTWTDRGRSGVRGPPLASSARAHRHDGRPPTYEAPGRDAGASLQNVLPTGECHPRSALIWSTRDSEALTSARLLGRVQG